MYDLAENCLACHLSSPVWSRLNLRDTQSSVLAAESRKYLSPQGSPETDALKFYVAQHAVWLLRRRYQDHQPLTPEATELAKGCAKVMERVPMRVLSYLTQICVEEARFLNWSSQRGNFEDLLASNYGQVFLDYAKQGFCAKASGRGSDLLSFEKLDMTIGQLTRGLTGVFNYGKWPGGYGGTAWGEIAKATHDALVGRASLIEMSDLAFSLCHNNGSMFNKGKNYSMYSSGKDGIYDILDVQASGQVPQWLLAGHARQFVDAPLQALLSAMKKEFPEEMSRKVDHSLIKDSASKRQAKEKMKHKAWHQQAQQQEEADLEIPKVQAIDNMLIDTFKGKKWIP